MKKIVSLLLSLTLLLGLTAGCGSVTEPAVPSSSTEETVSESTVSALEESEASEAELAGDESQEEASAPEETPSCTNQVEYPICEDGLTLSIFWQFHNFLSNFNVTQDVIPMVPTFSAAEEATGVTLDFQLEGEEVYGEKLRLLWASGDYCDFYCMAEMNYTAGVDSAVEQEILLNMVPYLEDCAPDYLRIMESHPDFRTELTSAGGNIVSFTEYCEYVDSGAVIRADWLRQVDMEYPTTMEEVADVARAFKEKLGIRNGVMWNSDLSTSIAWNGFGVEKPGSTDLGFQVDEGGKTVLASITLEGSQKALQWMHDCYEEGLCTDDFLNVHALNYDNYVYANECGIAFGNSNILAASGAERSGQPDYDLRAIPDPLEKAGMVNSLGKKSGGTGASSISVSAQTEYPEESIEYMNWIYTEDGILVSNYGVEGQGFTYDENGKPQYTNLITNNPDGIPAFVATFLYTSLVGTPYLNTTERKIASFSTEAEKECLEVWLTNHTGTALYQGKLTLEESEEYNSLASDITTHLNTEILNFVVGRRSLDEYDAFLEELESMGLSRMVEIKQAAYDRYLEAQ